MLVAPDIAKPAITHVQCPAGYRRHAQCGFLRVPLDHGNPRAKAIRIYFERYLRNDRRDPADATIVAIEGGPGYGTTADRDSRLAVWHPVSKHRDLLLVDLRGTGRSDALRCRAFSRHIFNYAVRAGRCARQLGPRRRFYDTSQSVQDIESLLRALHAGPVDLYGDSYGSYAAQAFALRYPVRLRSLTLDSTYPLPGTDPAFLDLAARSRRAIRLACERWPQCPTSQPMALLRSMVRQVRGHPISGTAPNGDGTPTHTVVDEKGLAQTVQAIYGNLAPLRDLPAAILSAQAGDTRPLLRLMAENSFADEASAPSDFSEALYLSVICHDYPQPWPAGTPIAGRTAAMETLFGSYPPQAFDPFSVNVWAGLDYEGAQACLHWRDSPATTDPPDPPGAVYPDVPTLVINGDLDNITPLEDARRVAARFPDSTLVTVQNVNHVQVMGDQFDCASVIYERFVRTLSTGDTSCTRRTAPVRVVNRFPLALDQVGPAESSRGDRSSTTDRRLAAAAAETVSDMLQRWWVNYDGSGVGLRGGTWWYSGYDLNTFHLTKVQWVPGIRVSGLAKWRYSSGAVLAHVTVAGAGTREHVRMRWSLAGPHGQARIDGTAGGAALHAHMPAP
jgi:pimeloyl-ACP methyl ester carboxylesterase